MTGVRLTNVKKAFGATEVIHDVSLIVPKGVFAVFVGPSGCGKSTLLRMIAGLEETSGGRIEIEGTDVTDSEPADRGVAMVFQNYALYPHLSVYENMAFSMRIASANKAKIDEKVYEAARILQLEDQLKKRPAELSGGQRQRVAIGRAIVRQPKVFLFDEPLSNLDAELRVQMRLELSRLHRQIGATMIYVTHDQVEAMTLADEIFVLKGGEVQQSGAPLELYDDPDNRFVGGFIGSPSMNFLPARVFGEANGQLMAALEAEGGAVFKAAMSGFLPAEGTKVVLGVRPEHLRLEDTTATPPGAADAGGAISLPVTVEMTEALGGVSYLHTRTGDGQQVVVERHQLREALEGREVRLSADPSNILVFDTDGTRLR